MADGLLPVLDRPETSWFASFLYPLRSSEIIGVTASLTVVFWVFITVVPEYCVTLMSDADSMGYDLLGMLFAVISMLPVVFLLPFALFYWLQYFGRILVASASGETIPPRSPDRNFEGFFHGMSAWVIWLVLGVGVGLSPLLLYAVIKGAISDCSPWLALGLLLLGLPYVLMALMMTFLHDDGLAAKPWNVLGTLARLSVSFGPVCVIVAVAGVLVFSSFRVALLFRDHYVWIYLLFCLPCWLAAHWASFVVRASWGCTTFTTETRLRWHRERPRWGIAWKI